jgi:hypothetical protein
VQRSATQCHADVQHSAPPPPNNSLAISHTRLSVSPVTAPVFGETSAPSDFAVEYVVDAAGVAATPYDRATPPHAHTNTQEFTHI